MNEDWTQNDLNNDPEIHDTWYILSPYTSFTAMCTIPGADYSIAN